MAMEKKQFGFGKSQATKRAVASCATRNRNNFFSATFKNCAWPLERNENGASKFGRNAVRLFVND